MKIEIPYLMFIAPGAIILVLLSSYLIKAEPTIVTRTAGSISVSEPVTPGRMIMSTWAITQEAQANNEPVNETVASTPVPVVAEAVPEPQPQPTKAATPKIGANPKVATSTLKPTAATLPKPAAAPAVCSGAYAQEFLCLLNQYRASQGKGKLSFSSSLSGVSLSYSKWMESTGTFSHTGENGSRFFNRCADAGVKCRAENLALNAGSAANLLKMWKESPGHNANLLGSYTTIGLGGSGGYITALFN